MQETRTGSSGVNLQTMFNRGRKDTRTLRGHREKSRPASLEVEMYKEGDELTLEHQNGFKHPISVNLGDEDCFLLQLSMYNLFV